eukprot:SAG31_NODE_64_length_28590_cov_17.914464_12_plen_83_part_00
MIHHQLMNVESLHVAGNKFFKAGLYDKAVESYTEALAAMPSSHPREAAIILANRALCRTKVQPHCAADFCDCHFHTWVAHLD